MVDQKRFNAAKMFVYDVSTRAKQSCVVQPVVGLSESRDVSIYRSLLWKERSGPLPGTLFSRDIDSTSAYDDIISVFGQQLFVQHMRRASYRQALCSHEAHGGIRLLYMK